MHSEKFNNNNNKIKCPLGLKTIKQFQSKSTDLLDLLQMVNGLVVTVRYLYVRIMR